MEGKMYFRIVLSTIILFSVSLIYFSCDTITNTTLNVTGKIYSYNHSPVSNIKVIIRDQFVITSEDGGFTFNNVAFPYDLIVMDSLSRDVTFYKGLSTDNVSLPYSFNGSNSQFAFITVTIPEKILQSNVIGKVIFTDGNFVNTYANIGLNNPEIRIDSYIDKRVTGKLIVLTYKTDGSDKILSYENYGESPDIQIQPGGQYNYQFDSLGLALNPGEQNVSGSLQIPPGSKPSYSDFSLSFTNKLSRHSRLRFSTIGLYDFNFLIPTGLPRQFNTIVANNTNGENAGFMIEDFIINPDLSNNLQVKIAPSIISPENHIKNVSNNTQFSFTNGTGDGIYIIELHNTSRQFYYTIVTSDLNFTLEDLEHLGFGRINNNYFYWHVQKTGHANSMDDYVTNFFNSAGYFNTISETRFFSTEP